MDDRTCPRCNQHTTVRRGWLGNDDKWYHHNCLLATCSEAVIKDSNDAESARRLAQIKKYKEDFHV